jgi:hypothetical protein
VSYLNPLRLHFAGTFEAAVSTVNNDPVHYDNARFTASYGLPESGTALNGSFNPRGSGSWRLHDCAVTAAFLADGSPAAGTDPVLNCLVADSDRRVPAKLVDLDPEQQLVSSIFGLEMRIATAAGETLLRGDFAHAAFMDIWDRALDVPVSGPGRGDVAAGAMYQSVLARVTWGDVSGSPFLRALRDAVSGESLSVKFNVDGFGKAPGDDFLRGRIVGTIGPAAPGEPRHFVAGRQFMAAPGAGGHFFVPAGGVNFCVASVDRSTRRVYVDLGNALPTAVPGGTPSCLGDLALRASAGAAPLGVLPAQSYTQPAWYPSTAGVAVFPPGRPLSDAELDAVAAGPLSLVTVPPPGGRASTVISEQELFVRADQFVFRLDPGTTATVALYATQFGQPYPGAGVLMVPVPGQLQPDSPLAPGQAPPVAVPASALEYPVRAVTDSLGRAELRLRARDPGRPRDYIDGQVYALCPVLEPTIVSPFAPYPFNQWNFVSALVWSGFKPDEPPTWHGAIEPVLRQYGNLYPVMRDFLDLGDYKQVCAHAVWLAIAFGRGIDDPGAMPVSRDLSAAKRKALLRWLTQPGPDGLPLLGEPPVPAAALSSQAAPSEAGPGASPPPGSPPGSAPGSPPGSAAGSAPEGQVPPHAGGKAAAASRRPAAKRGPRPAGGQR